jgi:hypothetical protein
MRPSTLALQMPTKSKEESISTFERTCSLPFATETIVGHAAQLKIRYTARNR